MKKSRALLCFSLLSVTVGGCSITRNVRPVGRGNAEVGASVGGPIFANLGQPIPTPVVAAYGRYGLDERTDVDVGLYLPVVRAAGIDVGIARQVLAQDGAVPAVTVGGRLLVFGNAKAMIFRKDSITGQTYALGARLFEQVYGTASWAPRPACLTWAGLSAFTQVEHGTVRPAVYGGASVEVGERWRLGAELAWIAFLSNQSSLAVDYVGIAGHGALAVQLGASYRFEDFLGGN